jgi:hypothetical protein
LTVGRLQQAVGSSIVNCLLQTVFCRLFMQQIAAGCGLTPLKKSRFDFFGKREK